MSSPITLTGRLAKMHDPTISPAGVCRVRFSLATSRRQKQGDKWIDTDTTFWNVTAWREVAEHLADSSLPLGTELVVFGDVAEQAWTDNSGQERKAMAVTAKTIAVSLNRGTVTTTARQRPTTAPAADDPWAT